MLQNTVFVCGTGTDPVVPPGDPDNVVFLSAVGVFAGINVSWTYPRVNPNAVAHTLLYRSTSSNFNSAVQQAVVAGNKYFDANTAKVPPVYYYWITIVSVNGTVGPLIGPASAQARSTSDDLLDELTGKIAEGVLATALRADIARIALLRADLLTEIANRINDGGALSRALRDVENGLAAAQTFLYNESTSRISGDAALLNNINIMAAAIAGSIAALVTEVNISVTKTEAVATRVTQLSASVNGRIDGALGLITEEASTRATAISVVSQTINQTAASLGSRVDGVQATVTAETQARVDANNSTATRIDSVQSTLNGNMAAVETRAGTLIGVVNGKVDSIGALWTVKVKANGLVGGFGVYNNGAEVQAGFDVDTFWIGRTGSTNVLPFVISDGVVYINKARIKDADIDTLKIAGNAVTVPASSTGAESASVTITAIVGKPIYIHTYAAPAVYSGSEGEYRVISGYVNGALAVIESCDYTRTSGVGNVLHFPSVSQMFVYYPPNDGAYTFTLTARGSCSVFVQQTKR